MARLRQLREDAAYRACEWDLKADAGCRQYWVGIFRNHADVLLAAIRESYPAAPADQLEALRRRYDQAIRSFLQRPESHARIDILTLDVTRTAVLEEFGFVDPFRVQKERENATALRLLPGLLEELDSRGAARRAETLAGALLAGNLFDLGAAAALRHVRDHGGDFERLMRSQPPRPWLIDDVCAWVRRWDERPYRHVAFFVDNAGADFCLGCLPLARWMASRGARVTLAANTGPALNDVTADEAQRLLAEAARLDETLGALLAGERLSLVASGSASPLLDLANLAPECVERVAGADLVILHGMGRALESNYSARLTCDTLRCAVAKDAAVARWLGGRLFDCVFKLTTE